MRRPKALALDEAVGLVEPLLRRLLPENVALEIEREDGLAEIVADRAQLEQVILNLALNARDAMPRGGTLSIETRSVRVGDTIAASRAPGEPPLRALLVVRDTGTGMDRATQERIFEPFFTTKRTGKGTGLGLATVHGIVRQARGALRVESAPGEGTAFYVGFPGPEHAPGAASVDVESPAGKREELRSAQILLCEDDESVRTVVTNMLRFGGHAVRASRDGAEAIHLVEQGSFAPELLVTDVVMGDMSGRDVSERLSRMIPGLRTLYISGYTDDIIAPHGVLEEDISLLQKPFTRAALLEAVGQELARVGQDS